MQWNKLQNIMITILLIVNILLFSSLAYNAHETAVREQNNLKNVQVVLARYGASLCEDFQIPGDAMMPRLHVERRRADEEAVALAMLSEAYSRKEEDGVVYFESEYGYLTWSSDGYMEAGVFYEDSDATQDVGKRAQQFFQSWGLLPDNGEISVIENTAELTSPVAGYPVFNRHLTLFFGEGEITLNGWWSFDMPYAIASEPDTSCNASDALLNFAAKQEMDVGKIENMTLGYCLQPNGGRRLLMSPAWKIETTQGTFIVDETGSEINL